jgi:hypothetical protein
VTTLIPVTPTPAPTPEARSYSPTADDDYDTWCEYGSICHRLITDYIEETKGNAAWGDQDGVEGSYDAIVKTELKGRIAYSTVTLIWDTGPSLQFGGTYLQCTDDAGIPYSCGTSELPDARIGIAGFRHRFDTVAGNRLRNADSYHSSLHTAFTPNGYGQQTTSPLSTLSWQCPPDTIDGCYFPEDTDDIPMSSPANVDDGEHEG